jgi:hypothetical protein
MNYNYDIVIVGGGPAGCGAAIAAARRNDSVLVVERFNCLGGMATSGLLGFLGPFDNAERNEADWIRFRLDAEGKEYPPELDVGDRIVRGIPEEVLNRVDALGGAEIPKYGYIPANPETVKFVLDNMAQEAGVDIRYYTLAVGAEKKKDGVELILASKKGVESVRARRVIDATGDGDVAVALGADYQKGRQSDGAMQGTTLVFRLGNVKADPLDFLPDVSKDEYHYDEAAREAYEKGEISFPLEGVGCMSLVPGMEGCFTVNQQHTFDIDGTDPDDLTKATINGRRQIREIVEFFRRHVHGCEDCYLIDTASTLGVRETRRIVGDYMLTSEDVLKGHQFEDSVCRYGYYLDIHLPDGKDYEQPEPGTDYGIPYRCLTPKGISDLLVAGRCISTTHKALSSMRLMTCCMAIGQAAGTAAALSIQTNRDMHDLNVNHLRQELEVDGAIV